MFIAHMSGTPHMPHEGAELWLFTLALALIFAAVLAVGLISSRK